MSSRVLPAGDHVLVVDGHHVAPLRLAVTHRDKGRGLLGSDGIDGALWLDRASSVHMVGMRYAIDVAVVARDGTVLHAATLRPWVGATRPRLRGHAVVEAEAGAMAGWGLQVGSRVQVLSPSGDRVRPA